MKRIGLGMVILLDKQDVEDLLGRHERARRASRPEAQIAKESGLYSLRLLSTTQTLALLPADQASDHEKLGNLAVTQAISKPEIGRVAVTPTISKLEIGRVAATNRIITRAFGGVAVTDTPKFPPSIR